MTTRFGSRPRRSTALSRLGVLLLVVVCSATALGVAQARGKLGHAASNPAVPLDVSARLAEPVLTGTAGPDGNDDRRTLVLYDDGRRQGSNRPATAAEARESEAYGMFTANLVSRATAWDLRPAADYRSGDIEDFDAVVYVGSVSDALLPASLIGDLATATVPVVWMGINIDQLFAADRSAGQRLGWSATTTRDDRPATVRYKGVDLSRQRAAGDPVMDVRIADPGRVRTLAEVVAPSGATSPWAVRSGQFTYVAGIPYTYLRPGDRYLAAADILLSALAPATPERHRALVRIEDIGPRTDPDRIRAITDVLAARDIPFTLAVYPYYADPHGQAHDGQPTFTRLVDAPELVAALKDAVRRGATIIMHGYSHQYGELDNPYNAVSAADYEFIRSRKVDGRVVTGGPVPADSPEWFTQRITTGLAEFRRVGLPVPRIFEFPHYGGSAVDYHTTTRLFDARYDQGSYYAGYCRGGECGAVGAVSYAEVHSQYFPYPVRDVYGAVVIPENLGHVAPRSFDQHDPRSVDDILTDARKSLVVRDNVASFFYHPFLGTERLERLVDGFDSMGYRFTTPAKVADF